MKGPSTGSRKWLWVILWLGPLAVAWTVLILLSHQTTHWAIAWTGRGFALMIPATYVAIWGWAITASHDRRSTLIRCLAASMVAGSILVILETPATLKLVHWPLVFEKVAGDGTNFYWAYRLDPDLGFRRQPNDRWSGRPKSDMGFSYLREPITFTYDRWGYRNESPPDQADLVLIGDSYVEGWLVSDEHTVARRMEALLARPVINLGVAGYGTMHELIVLRKDAVRYRPRVAIWFFFEGNDLYDDEDFENAMLAEPPEREQTELDPQGFRRNEGWWERSFSRATYVRLRRWAYPIMPKQGTYFGLLEVPGREDERVYFADYAAVPWSEWVQGRWRRARETLEQAVEFGRENGIHVLFCFVPIKFRVYRSFIAVPPNNPARDWDVWPIRERFLEFCDTNGAACVDLTGLFQQALAQGGMPYPAIDTHWSVDGHAMVAERLASELRQLGWLGAEKP